MKVAEDLILREIMGEYMLVPVGKTAQRFNGMITLSETGAFIWQQLEKVDSLEELVEKITAEFNIDAETARIDAIRFVGGMYESGFLIPTKEDRSW